MTTLYEKRGRRYLPVAEDRRWDSWPKGFHLVFCDPGVRSTRFSIEPETAGLLAAARAKEERLREVIGKHLYMRPARRPVTEAQKKAWMAFQKAMGNDGFIVEYESVQGIIDAVIDELLKDEK